MILFDGMRNGDRGIDVPPGTTACHEYTHRILHLFDIYFFATLKREMDRIIPISKI